MNLRDFVSVNRWPIAASIGVAVAAGAFGALIGLSPMLVVALIFAVAGPAFAISSRRARPSGFGTTLAVFSLVAVFALGVIQLVPYGRDHANPAITGEPAWSSPRTRELMVDACYACHSNEVDWPWYSNFAPISWAVTEHVEEGRDAVNYSEFATDPGDADETIEVILDGEMPPGYFTRFGLHPEADLSDDEVAELLAGLRATPGLSDDDDEREDDDEDEDED